MKCRLAGWLVPAAITVSTIVTAQERVHDAGAGIALTPPFGWQKATLAQVQANRENVRLPDPELQHALQTRSTLPLMVYTKYPEPHVGLNPSIQVTLRAGLRGTPQELLTMALEPLRRGFADFRIVTPVEATAIGGWPAAHVTATYTLRNQGGQVFPVRSRMWLVPRGNLMFLIGMSGRTTGEDACDQEFSAAAASIVIQQ